MDLNMNLWILYANCDDKMTALIKMIIFTEDKIMQPKKIFSENLLCEYSTFLYSASAQKNEEKLCNTEFLHKCEILK